ncbi:hypothetical protein ABXJ14_00185 (plasmid) [Morganella morganii]
MIHEAFERYLSRVGLLDDFTVQYLTWTEEPESRHSNMPLFSLTAAAEDLLTLAQMTM